jgi:hypothetical protein
LSSVVSTHEEDQDIDGQTVRVVVGQPVAQSKLSKFFTGNIPVRPPNAAGWDETFLDIPNFRPPSFNPHPTEGIPHLNLDAALEFLLGDQL